MERQSSLTSFFQTIHLLIATHYWNSLPFIAVQALIVQIFTLSPSSHLFRQFKIELTCQSKCYLVSHHQSKLKSDKMIFQTVQYNCVRCTPRNHLEVDLNLLVNQTGDHSTPSIISCSVLCVTLSTHHHHTSQKNNRSRQPCLFAQYYSSHCSQRWWFPNL